MRSPKLFNFDGAHTRGSFAGVRPNLLMGQRFLVSRPVLKKIISAAALSGNETVLEIGPGLGVLTRELARRARHVVAVEKDVRLAEQLEQRLAAELITNVRVIRGDILKISFADLKLPKDYSVVANIPYYLTSRLLRIVLAHEHPPKEIILMVQKEVAERIVAKPPKMNMLALSVQAYGTPEIIASVPREAFSPRPNVASAIMRISRVSRDFFASVKIDPDKFFRIIRAGFRARRKTLLNNLGKYLGDKKTAAAVLLTCGISPHARAETLSLEAWAMLTRAVADSTR